MGIHAKRNTIWKSQKYFKGEKKMTTQEIVEQVFGVQLENIPEEEMKAFLDSINEAEQEGEFEIQFVEEMTTND